MQIHETPPKLTLNMETISSYLIPPLVFFFQISHTLCKIPKRLDDWNECYLQPWPRGIALKRISDWYPVLPQKQNDKPAHA